MTPVKRVLVPVDLDEGSRRSIEYALSIVEPSGGSVDVVYVWEPPKLVRPDLMVYLNADGQAMTLAEFTQNQARADLAKVVTEVAPDRANVSAQVVLGSPAQQILQLSKTGDHDLLVMGTRGRTGLSRALLGSVAEKV